MSEKMKAAVMHGIRDVRLEEIDKPVCGDDQILVKVQAVGVCGSDLHYYTEGAIGDFAVKPPFILGHESAGAVCEVGKSVSGFKAGDRVSLEPGVPCGKCGFCKEGRYNLCPDVIFFATPPVDGVFAEYVAYPPEWAFKLPDNMSFAEGALIEPLSVGIHAANQGGADLGKSALIFGCGCIGLVTLMALKSKGVSDIYMCDMVGLRMEKAKELGASAVFDVSKCDVIDEVMKLTDGQGVDTVYEMTGAEKAVQSCGKAVKRGGTVVLVGMGSKTNIMFDFGDILFKEAEIKTVFRYRNIYGGAIQAVKGGSIPLKKIVSHSYKLDNISKALEYHVENKSDIIKMVIEM